MKRKRGHKKGKHKGGSNVSTKEALVNVENDSGLEEFDNGSKYNSPMEVDTPSSTGTDQPPHNLANVNLDGLMAKGVVKPVGRVKVKLKTPKRMESHVNSSDVPTQSDTDKSSQQMGMGLEKLGIVAEKMEDSANSLPEGKLSVPESLSKKAGSIKIKTSKAVESSAYQSNDGVAKPKKPRQDSRYDKQELDAALKVIKKVMKMDAAEPFNVPVNPVALGIPDYFDVIDTPMDFGTICHNLENGVKYANSEDVFKDVQYIWDNCYKYNNKGDYILELLKRVKKNFTKYWTAAGLYSGQSQGIGGVDNIQENAAPSGQIKVYLKGGLSKKTARKGHGRRHKSDCLCAICVLKRRRREREENARIATGQIGVSDNNLPQDFKQEESSHADSPSGGNSSSNIDESSIDPNADAGEEERKDMTMEENEQHCRPLEEDEDEEGVDEDEENEIEMKNEDEKENTFKDTIRQSQQSISEKSDPGVQSDKDTAEQLKEGTLAVPEQKLEETQETRQKIKEKLKMQFENPMVLDLCGVLFPEKCKSIWNGSHSMVHRPSTTRTSSSLHAAISTFFK
ncbi:hypothetical protein UlMin_030516 [Ulmus minor]